MLICLQLERIRNGDALIGGALNAMEHLEERADEPAVEPADKPTDEPTDEPVYESADELADELPREANRPPTLPHRPRRQRATELEMMMRDNPTYEEHEGRAQRTKRV